MTRGRLIREFEVIFEVIENYYSENGRAEFDTLQEAFADVEKRLTNPIGGPSAYQRLEILRYEKMVS